MQSLLPPSFYRDASVFRQELMSIFRTSWQLAGFRDDLENPNDYVVAAVNGKSVVIQNFQGELRAFHNVCAHRQSRLRSDARGNGPLRCPYHGWTYNKDGIAVGIPNKSLFEAAELEGSVTLDRLAVESCGALVFVNGDDAAESLPDFLGLAYEFVRSVGDALGEQLSCYSLLVRANWKIIIENTLEGYHVSSVHAGSLQKLGTSGIDNTIQGAHSTYRSPLDTKPSATRDRLDRAFESRPLHTDQYIHQLLFPNTTIATARGTSFNVNIIRPLGAMETEIAVYSFATKLGEISRPESAMVKAMSPAVVELTNRTFDEDKAICEQVQLGLSETSRRAIFSSEEQRIHAFQAAYLRALGEPAERP